MVNAVLGRFAYATSIAAKEEAKVSPVTFMEEVLIGKPAINVEILSAIENNLPQLRAHCDLFPLLGRRDLDDLRWGVWHHDSVTDLKCISRSLGKVLAFCDWSKIGVDDNDLHVLRWCLASVGDLYRNREFLIVGRKVEPWIIGQLGTEAYPRSLINSYRVYLLGDGVAHGQQLKIVDDTDPNCDNQTPKCDIEGVGFTDRFHIRSPFWALPLSLGECLFWFGFCYLFARLHLLYCGGRSIPLFWLTLVLLAVSAAQFVKSVLRVHDNIVLVTQKCLTNYTFCNTVIGMANVLSMDRQIAVIGALAEGSSIRSIERITGIHRDSIMRLGVRIGQNCQLLLDSKMQDLNCNYLQLDEVWGYIGKKERHCSVDDNPEHGDVWTFCAIDAETKLVPSFRCGKRTHELANDFLQDIASRVRNRVQISTDALNSYPQAIEQAFGADVDYGQIVKVYTHDAAQHPERKYSAPSFASAYRRAIAGNPQMELVSTSHVERLNATTRLHVKRLSRLTLAFSKKLENFKAAVALHFAYYNLVRRHATLRCTPAMAAGVEKDFWTVGQLVEATS